MISAYSGHTRVHSKIGVSAEFLELVLLGSIFLDSCGASHEAKT